MASDNTDENASNAYSSYGLIQEQMFRWEDVIGDDIDTPYDIWRKYYYCIQTASAAIEAINKIADEGKVSSEDAIKGVEAEALLCRAYAHFILVNLFSKSYDPATADTDLGIPYIETPDHTLLVEHDRGNVADVYEKINRDIEIALPNVTKIVVAPTSNNQGLIQKYHWNKDAAYAFAAEFNLYYKNYKKAIEYATVALTDNPAAKLRDWRTDGQSASKTSIAFNRYIAADQKANFLLTAAESIWGRVSGPYQIGKRFAMQGVTLNELTTGDSHYMPIGGAVRYRCLVYLSGAIAVMPKVGEFFEYFDKVAGIGWTHTVQALFTADKTLINRAEAYALDGDLDNATKDLDTFTRVFTHYYTDYRHTESKEKLISFVRNSSNEYDPMTGAGGKYKKEIHLEGISQDQKDVLQGILLMKRFLTLHEGSRWFDINRYKIEIYRRIIYDGTPMVTDKLTVDDPRRVFQIPQQMVVAGVQPNPR